MIIGKRMLSLRRHGYKARQEAIDRLIRVCTPEIEPREPGAFVRRRQTAVTFETRSQSYLWVTGREKSRLIKH